MHKLASDIRSRLDGLARAYDRQLQTIDGYATMPASERFLAAQSALRMMAAGFEVEDSEVFSQFAQSEASERLAQGFSLESVERALVSLVDILEPLLNTVETANLMWRSMLQVHEALSEMITEQKVSTADMAVGQRAEQTLRQQREEYGRILDAVPAMIWYKDRENRILRLNKAAAATMGLSVQQVEGRSVYELNPDEAEAYHRDDLEVINSGKPKLGIVEPLVSASGATRWLQTDKIPYVDEDGNIVGVIVFGQDITQRQRLQRQIQESLERRGHQVQISTQVAQEIALAPALEDLYQRVVTLVKERFGYYHAQLFLVSPEGDRLLTVAGYGDVGKQFVEMGHSMAMGTGVVGRAGASGQPVLSSDVSQDPQWLYHPLLPETKGELAVPIMVRRSDRDRLLGVLDVQSDKAGELTEDDQILFEGLCGQIAVAIESTRLRQEMEDSLRELERLYRALSREGWEGFGRETAVSGYWFNRTAVIPIDASWEPGEAVKHEHLPQPDVQAEAQADEPTSRADVDSRGAVHVTPLSSRGETFGVLGVQSGSSDPLSGDELALVESVADQVAQALESARLFQQTQSALAETEDLYRASADLNAAQTLDSVLAALRGHSVLGQADQGARIVLFDQPLNGEDEAEGIIVAARWDQMPSAHSERHRLRDLPSLAHLLRPDAPTTIDDVDTDPRLDANARALYSEQYGARSVIAVPLVAGGQWLGFAEGLYAEQTEVPEVEVRRLAALAAQAAVAVQGIRQLESIEALAERERLVRSITDRVRRETGREAIMRTAIQELSQMLGADSSVVRLGSGQSLLAEADSAQPGSVEAQRDAYIQAQEGSLGYYRFGEEEGFADDVWLSGMTPAVQQKGRVSKISAEGVSFLAVPMHLHGDIIGALGFERRAGEGWSAEEVTAVETIVEQLAWALEGQRLFDEEQQARALMTMRVGALDALNDIGRKIDDAPSIGEFLQWVAGRIPSAMQFPELCRVAIEFEGAAYGSAEAVGLPCQIVQSVDVGGREVGKVTIGYTEQREFLGEESALLGDIGRRIGGYIENRSLLQQEQARAEEQAMLRRITEAVSRSLEMQDLLGTTIDTLRPALGFDAVLVSLTDKETGRLYLAAEEGLPQAMARQLEQDGMEGTLCDYVFQTGQTTALGDVRQESPVPVEGLIRLGLLSYVGVPLEYLGERLGTICCFNEFVREFSANELLLLEAIGDQIGVGVANARLFSETQAALAEVEATHRSYLRQAWQDHLRQRDILRKSAFLYDGTETEQPEEVRIVPDLWLPEMERVLAQSVVASSDDGGEVATGGHAGSGEGLALPISIRGETIGVLGVEAPSTDHKWTDEERALLQTVGEQLGQALEGARLFADTQRRAERERLIGEITAKIRASTDMHAILQTAAEELGLALGTSRARLQIGQPESDVDGVPVIGDRDKAPPRAGQEPPPRDEATQ